MGRVLLIGAFQDPHVFELRAEIERLGHSTTILDAKRSSNTLALGFTPTGIPKLIIRESAGEDQIEACDVTSIWFRLKPIIPHPSWSPLETSAARFCQDEWRTVLKYLGDAAPEAYWVNPPEAQLTISSKPRQLALAASLGLRIPDTVITNDPAAVLNFFDRHERVIYKTLNGFIFPDQTGILTNEISKADVLPKGANIQRAPGIFQELVQKSHELRVTIVGDKVFPALVRTPQNGDASIDWRHAHLDDIFELCEIDSGIVAKLLRFHRDAGLVFGTYDLIVGQDGTHTFLECNPAGQFLWLEYSLKIPIMAHIASTLINKGL